MILSIDIGNSNYKLGLFSNGVLTATLRTPSLTEIVKFIEQYRIGVVKISSVNNDKLNPLLEVLANYRSIATSVINSYKNFKFKISYKTPETLGIDRLIGINGALSILEMREAFEYNTLITVDLGTATTINVFRRTEGFIGGSILPGIRTMTHSLFSNTDNLPLISEINNVDIVGKTTIDCIKAGIIYSTIGAIEKTVGFYSAIDGVHPELFITGGEAPKILDYLTYKNEYVEWLNLIGLQTL